MPLIYSFILSTILLNHSAISSFVWASNVLPSFVRIYALCWSADISFRSLATTASQLFFLSIAVATSSKFSFETFDKSLKPTRKMLLSHSFIFEITFGVGTSFMKTSLKLEEIFLLLSMIKYYL